MAIRSEEIVRDPADWVFGPDLYSIDYVVSKKFSPHRHPKEHLKRVKSKGHSFSNSGLDEAVSTLPGLKNITLGLIPLAPMLQQRGMERTPLNSILSKTVQLPSQNENGGEQSLKEAWNKSVFKASEQWSNGFASYDWPFVGALPQVFGAINFKYWKPSFTVTSRARAPCKPMSARPFHTESLKLPLTAGSRQFCILDMLFFVNQTRIEGVNREDFGGSCTCLILSRPPELCSKPG